MIIFIKREGDFRNLYDFQISDSPENPKFIEDFHEARTRSRGHFKVQLSLLRRIHKFRKNL